MNSLFKNFNVLSAPSTELIDCLLNLLHEVRLPRKEHLVTPDQVNTNIYFLESGLLMTYYTQRSKTFSSQFIKEGGMCIPTETPSSSFPHPECIIAMEDCLLYYINKDDLRFVQEQFPEFSIVLLSFYKESYLQTIELSNIIRQTNASSRYKWLTQSQPEIARKVPARHLASYIGITEVMLSRINQKL
jgi:CRP-like cAMP-binding protein